MGSNPPLVYINFSFVEITNLYHLWIFNIILDMKQAEKVLGNFGYVKKDFDPCEIKSKCETAKIIHQTF